MSEQPATPSAIASLPRRLGAWSALGAMIGTIIGSGIFRVPSGVATYLPTPSVFLLVWVAGGLFALCGALIYAEFAAMFPVSGGRYIYLREGIGRMPAFVYAWTSTLLLKPASIGAIALVFAAYLGTLIPALASRERETALLLLLLIGAVNYRSAILGARLTILTTAAKVLAVAALAVILLIAVSPATPIAEQSAAAFTWQGFGLAMVIVMWTYSGWDTPTLLTGEVSDPGRTMPRVLIGGMLAMIVLFVAVNLAYLRALSIPEIAASSAVAADAVGRQFGSTGMQLVALMVAVSTLGTLCAELLTTPRLAFALGGDIPRLRHLGKVHVAHGTPHIGVAVTALLSIVCVWNRSFEQLAETFIIGSWPFQMMVAFGLMRLRWKRPGLSRPFRTPWYPAVPLLFLLVSTGMLVSAVIENPRDAVLGTLLILGGVPVYYLLRTKWGMNPGS